MANDGLTDSDYGTAQHPDWTPDDGPPMPRRYVWDIEDGDVVIFDAEAAGEASVRSDRAVNLGDKR